MPKLFEGVLSPHEHRRNLTTGGVPLNHLVGQYFRVGDCVLYGGRLNVPCMYLESVTGKPVFKPLLNRSGLNCRVITGGMARAGDTVCFGKDWYRFPSSYFLPKGMHAKFVKSEFAGLLPGEFSEAKTGFGFFPGTWLVPRGMNDRNVEDPGKYVRGLNLGRVTCSWLTKTDQYTTLLIPG